MRISDWSSDVCSSDLPFPGGKSPTIGSGPTGFTHLSVRRATAIGNTHHCRPGTCSRDLLALAQGDALQRLYPSQPQGLPRPFERSGHWVPGTSHGTTALDLARASPSGTRCVNRSEEHTAELQSLMRIADTVIR